MDAVVVSLDNQQVEQQALAVLIDLWVLVVKTYRESEIINSCTNNLPAQTAILSTSYLNIVGYVSQQTAKNEYYQTMRGL